MQLLDHPYAKFLDQVEKRNRYTGAVVSGPICPGSRGSSPDYEQARARNAPSRAGRPRMKPQPTPILVALRQLQQGGYNRVIGRWARNNVFHECGRVKLEGYVHLGVEYLCASLRRCQQPS
jgi:hypothetical protein